MPTEGYVKFRCERTASGPVPEDRLAGISAWRYRLYKLGLIGAYPNGVGFGNISIRLPSGSFIITGTATGSLASLTGGHYTEVTGYDFGANRVSCKGSIDASSETMSHAAVYESAPDANAVIHVHDLAMWRALLGKVPTTSKDAEYGTPGLAYEIKRLFAETDVRETKIFVMAGHEEGVIAFGNDLDEAGNVILDHFGRLRKTS